MFSAKIVLFWVLRGCKEYIHDVLVCSGRSLKVSMILARVAEVLEGEVHMYKPCIHVNKAETGCFQPKSRFYNQMAAEDEKIKKIPGYRHARGYFTILYEK